MTCILLGRITADKPFIRPQLYFILSNFQIFQGIALATAKSVAGAFGIALHLSSVHRVVAALAVFYIAVAVVPWMAILFL